MFVFNSLWLEWEEVRWERSSWKLSTMSCCCCNHSYRGCKIWYGIKNIFTYSWKASFLPLDLSLQTKRTHHHKLPRTHKYNLSHKLTVATPIISAGRKTIVWYTCNSKHILHSQHLIKVAINIWVIKMKFVGLAAGLAAGLAVGLAAGLAMIATGNSRMLKEHAKTWGKAGCVRTTLMSCVSTYTLWESYTCALLPLGQRLARSCTWYSFLELRYSLAVLRFVHIYTFILFIKLLWYSINTPSK